MSEAIVTNCENCGADINTLRYKGKGIPTENKPLGHKDPRHNCGSYCSIECSKEHSNNGGTIYKKI